jgi:acetyltransferase
MYPSLNLLDRLSHAEEAEFDYQTYVSRGVGVTQVAATCAEVTVRQANETDADGLRRFIGRLSERTVYLRFFTGLGRVPNRFLTWLLPHGSNRVVLLAEDGGEIVGHAMYTADPAGCGAADLAVVVADGWQGCGIGPRLVEDLLGIGQVRGVREIRLTVLAGNPRANRLVARVWPGARPVLAEGVYEYVLPVAIAAAA